MYDNILIPTDGSEGIRRVLPHGIDIARNHDATVHSIYVIDRRHYLAAPDEAQDQIRASLEAEGTEALAAVTEELDREGIDLVSELRDGIPYREILSYIDEHDIDLVVIGTHGRTGRDRLAHLGSVTDRVLKNATVPVFVVNIGMTDDE